MQTSNHILSYAAGAAILSLGISTTSISEPAALHTAHKTTHAALYSNGVVLNRKSRTASEYIASVRRNPQRKAAMDRAAQEMAGLLKQNIGASTILEMRLAQGLTQSELAAKAGLPQPYLSRIENKRQSFQDSTVIKLAAALHSTPEEIRSAFEAQWNYIESKT